jgi:regulatory protein
MTTRPRRRRASPEERSVPPNPRDLSAAALRLLARRDYSVRELTDRLVDRGFAVERVGILIANLTAKGLLDDRRTATAVLRRSAELKGRGPLRIRRELEARGYEAALVRELLGGLSQDTEDETLGRLLRRWRAATTTDPAARRRLIGRLLRRGFSSGAIGRALREAVDDE